MPENPNYPVFLAWDPATKKLVAVDLSVPQGVPKGEPVPPPVADPANDPELERAKVARLI